MKTTTRRLGILALMLVCVTGVTSVAAKDRFGLGLKAGTYGFGADFGVAVIDQVAFRVSFQYANISISESLEDVDYDAELPLGGNGLLIDVFPMGGQFRITAGVFRNRNGLSLSGITFEDVDIGNNTYTPQEVGVLTGQIDFDDTAPYLGVGWGNIARGKKRLRFVADLGLLKQGSGKVSLSSSTGLIDPADLAQEIADIEDDISDYDLWPVINLGLGIRF